MNILFDHQAFTGMTFGGITRYFAELLRWLPTQPDVHVELSLRLSNNEYLADVPLARHQTFSPFAQSPTANRVASQVNRLYSLQRLRAQRTALFHPTYYHTYFLKALGARPLVITFHDATSERYGQRFPQVGQHLTTVKRALLRRADRIITVSEFSRQELHHFFDVDASRVEVIHLGTTFSDTPPPATARQVPFRYVLFVGKRAFYKNFDYFFQAIRPLLARHPDLHVVCGGAEPFSADEQRSFRGAGLVDRVHHYPATDAVLFNLYQHAEAFVFPSLNEGFGLPVLEAFSAGCPAVLSERSALPEVGGPAAQYFDPEDADSIGIAVEGVLTNSALRQQMVRQGRERLAQFTGGTMTRKTLGVYQAVT